MRQPSGRSHSFKHRSPVGRPIVVDQYRFAVDDIENDDEDNNRQQQQQQQHHGHQTRRRSTPNVTRRSSFNQR